MGKGLPADVTAIGLLTAVRSHVRLERGGTGIALATHLAHIATRLTWCSFGLGCRGQVVHGLDVVGAGGHGGAVCNDGAGHREWENVERDGLHIVLVLRKTHTGPWDVAIDGVSRSVAASIGLSQCLHQFCTAFRSMDYTCHGIGKDGGRCSGVRA